MMARCGGKLNCNTRDRVNATTDIAGSGVLYAFLASALLTIGAIVYGYLSDSLPEWYLNETDKAVISSFQSRLPSEKSNHKLRSIWDTMKSIILFGRRPLHQSRKLSRAERQAAVTRFILTLSDQQLATGLAILIAAIANQCKLTVWEFQVAFSLAWFSSTTHLATLDCLREYFIKHGVVRNWRVFGMVALLLMLVYSLIMSMASIETTIPVACTFEYFGEEAVNSHDPLSIYLVISAALTLAFLLWNYVVRILWSYRRSGGRATTLERTVLSIRTRKYRKKMKTSKMEWEYIIDEGINLHRSSIRRRDLEKIEKSRGLRKIWLVCERASKIYSESFLALGPMLSFMVSFGFTQLYSNRWHSGTPITVDQSMNFGQITPLFLMVLPVFAAAEIYYEVQDKEPTSFSRDDPSIATTSRPLDKPLLSSAQLPTPSTVVELENLDLEQANRLYHRLLPKIKCFHHSDVKSIQKQAELATTSEEYKPVLELKAKLVCSYDRLQSLERSLVPTALTSIIEFTLCCAVCITLGILLNTEDPRAAPTIASIVLFGFYLFYTVSGLVADVVDAWVAISEIEYKELLSEAQENIRKQKMDGNTEKAEIMTPDSAMTPISSYATASSAITPISSQNGD